MLGKLISIIEKVIALSKMSATNHIGRIDFSAGEKSFVISLMPASNSVYKQEFRILLPYDSVIVLPFDDDVPEDKFIANTANLIYRLVSTYSPEQKLFVETLIS